MRHYRIIATGKVQGVGFRNFTKKYADSLNLKGSVENLSDGSVEIFVSLPNSCDLGSFLDTLNTGNGRMQVKNFSIEILENLNFNDFQIL